jgi:cyclophilin family peptidyl-prolyl cis-trans isomerase
MDHLWRRNKKTFDGTQESECALHVQNGDEILGQLEGVVFGDENAGMANTDKKKKRKKRKKGEASTENVVWKKKSIFFHVAVLER